MKEHIKLFLPATVVMAVLASMVFCFNLAWADDASLAASSGGNPSTFNAVRVADDQSNPADDAFDWTSVAKKLGQEAVSPESTSALAAAIATDLDSISQTVKDAIDDTQVIKLVSDQDPVNVKSGWYIVYDDTTMVMTLVDRPMTLSLKNYAPTLVKEVNKDGKWSHEALVGEGEPIDYRITATLPEGYSHFTEYNITFNDEWNPGLAIDSTSVKVSLSHDGQQTDITKIAEIIIGTTNLSVDIANLKDTEASDGDQVIVSYTMSLTKAAISGTAGMENTAYLEYPRRPDSKDRDKTVVDKTKVMTLELRVNKTDDKSKLLAGAEFTLSDADGKFISGDGTKRTEQFIYKTDEVGLLQGLPKLNAGTYVLDEVKAPSGYKLPDNTKTTIEIALSVNENNKYVLDAKAQGLGKLTEASADNGATTLVVINTVDGKEPPTGKEDTPKKSEIPENPISKTYKALKGGTVPQLGDVIASILIIGTIGGAITFIIAAIRKRQKRDEN